MGTETKQEEIGDIAMCCGTPLIWTFMFSGSEWYCRKCKHAWPMFSASSVSGTPELAAERDANKDWFHSIAQDCIPGGARRRGCDQCDKGENHIEHATPEQIAASDAAYGKLR